MPSPPPMTTGRSKCACVASGRISPAAAAKTRPAAKCWIAAVSFGPGGQEAAYQAPPIAAQTGISV
jgi:hypothetical protein